MIHFPINVTDRGLYWAENFLLALPSASELPLQGSQLATFERELDAHIEHCYGYVAEYFVESRVFLSVFTAYAKGTIPPAVIDDLVNVLRAQGERSRNIDEGADLFLRRAAFLRRLPLTDLEIGADLDALVEAAQLRA